jgi:hypothetical protein
VSDAPGPGESGPQTQVPAPPPPPPLPPTAAERGGMRALFLGMAGLVFTFLFLPVGVVLCVAAIVSGVRSRRRARRVLAPAPGAVPGAVLGAIGVALSCVSIALAAVVWNDLNHYTQCRESAITIDDRQSCQDQYFPRMERRLHIPQGSLERHRTWF